MKKEKKKGNSKFFIYSSYQKLLKEVFLRHKPQKTHAKELQMQIYKKLKVLCSKESQGELKRVMSNWRENIWNNNKK